MRRASLGAVLLVGALAFAGALRAPLPLRFALGTAALVPIAYLIGEATEATAEHTGPVIGGLLNATFGNVPELIISLFAVARGLDEFVRGSLVGSIVSNLLLVLGAAIVAGRRGALDRKGAAVSLGQTGFAASLFVLPAVAHGWNGGDQRFLAPVTLPVVIVLFAVYLVVTARRVVLSRRAHRFARAEELPPARALVRPLLVLAAACLATAYVSEALTRSVDAFARAAHLHPFFVAAVIVALVGNAAEHGAAITIAARGNMALATEIAFSSSAQVALFVVPGVVLLSCAVRPLPLAFTPIELGSIALAVAVPLLVLSARSVRRWHGAVLCATYAVVALRFAGAA